MARAPFSFRSELFLDGEARSVRHEPVRVEPELPVRGAGAGPQIEPVGVPRADDGPALPRAGGQRGAGVRARALRCVELPVALEHRDLGPAHGDRLAPALVDLVGADRGGCARFAALAHRWRGAERPYPPTKSEKHKSELQSLTKVVCSLFLLKTKLYPCTHSR